MRGREHSGDLPCWASGTSGTAQDPGRGGGNSVREWGKVCVLKDVSPALSEEPRAWSGGLQESWGTGY